MNIREKEPGKGEYTVTGWAAGQRMLLREERGKVLSKKTAFSKEERNREEVRMYCLCIEPLLLANNKGREIY